MGDDVDRHVTLVMGVAGEGVRWTIMYTPHALMRDSRKVRRFVIVRKGRAL